MSLHTPAIQDQSMPQPRNGVIFLPERGNSRGELGSHMLRFLRPYSPDPQKLCYVVDPNDSGSCRVMERIYGHVKTPPGRWQLMRGIEVPFDITLEENRDLFPVGVLHMTSPDRAFISCVPGEPRALDDFPFPPTSLLEPGAVDKYGQKQLASRWADYCLAHNIGADTPKADIQLAYWDMLKADINASCAGGVTLQDLLTGSEVPHNNHDVAM